MSSNSVSHVPTQQSVKTYVDTSVAGQLVYQSGYDAATNTPDLDTSPSGINKGFTYTVTAAGNFFTESMQIGDMLIAEIDDPTTLADWTTVNKNIPDIVDASTTAKGIIQIATTTEVAAATETIKAITPSSLSSIDTLGTITTGLWQGTAITDTYISSAATWNNKIDATDVTYANLNTNGDIGTGATQVAQGNHNHSGTYEPADSTISKKYSTSIGGSTSIAVTHSLGTKDVVAQVYRVAAPYDVIDCEMVQTSTSQTTFNFNTAPSASEYRVVIIG